MFSVTAPEGEFMTTLAEMEQRAAGRAQRLIAWARAAAIGEAYLGLSFIVRRVS